MRVRSNDGRLKIECREEFMAVSRRDILLGGAGMLGATTLSFPKPAIAQSEPIKIGWLAAMTGPSSAPTIGFNRGVIFAARRHQRRGRGQGPQDRDHHARYPGRSHQGGERHPGNDQPDQGPCDLGPGQFRRGARHDADHGARQDARPPPLCGRKPDPIPPNIPTPSGPRHRIRNGTTPSAATA